MAATETQDLLLKTPLHAAHVALGARMVPFAGYDMPVQYPTGIIAEHLWTRENAGLFDVSHMGQAILRSPSFEQTAHALESLVAADIMGLAPGQQRYTQLLNADGGIIDDLMVSRPVDPKREGELFLVVNAACKASDFKLIREALFGKADLHILDQHALIALQGPKAEAVLADLKTAIPLAFMSAMETSIGGHRVHVSRSGYTGEDGFEISVANADAMAVWKALSHDPRVKPIGLGARDSLRLEAGLCLYGHDIDETTTPVEAGLTWSIGKRRRQDGGFPGDERIRLELANGVGRKRVGIKLEGRQPAREGAEIRTGSGRVIGELTSGGFAPSINGPIGMGYVHPDSATPGTKVEVVVRGKGLPGVVAAMPFVPNGYKR
jgi:aminomethyltransferase